MRLLIAYGRRFVYPRPYKLIDLAEAAGMSISASPHRLRHGRASARPPGSSLVSPAPAAENSRGNKRRWRHGRAGDMSMGVPMPEQPDDQVFSDGQLFTGAYPTNREFVEQLRAWGFTQRKEDGVHLVFRGPKGGTLRVIRSQLGRADPAVLRTRPPGWPVSRPRSSGPGHRQGAPGPPAGCRLRWPCRLPRRKPAARDSVISRVLAIHAQVDRPLGFDQVVQWSGQQGDPRPGKHGQLGAAPGRTARPDQGRGVPVVRGPARSGQANPRTPPSFPPGPSPRRLPWPGIPGRALEPASPAGIPAAELFGQLYPEGVHVTGELFADLEQLLRLTGKLAAGGSGTAP